MAEERRELRNYKLNSVYADRVRQLGNSPALKNLNDEIALLRNTLEVIVNNINTPAEMLLWSDKIEKLSKGIRDTLETLQKLQERNKELLGRDTVLAIFDALMEKIVEKVTDPDIIKELAIDGHAIISKGIGG